MNRMDKLDRLSRELVEGKQSNCLEGYTSDALERRFQQRLERLQREQENFEAFMNAWDAVLGSAPMTLDNARTSLDEYTTDGRFGDPEVELQCCRLLSEVFNRYDNDVIAEWCRAHVDWVFGDVQWKCLRGCIDSPDFATDYWYQQHVKRPAALKHDKGEGGLKG